MGAIWFRRAELIGASSDTVGYKAGVALSREDLAAHTEGMGIDDWWVGDDAETLRIRSEEFAAAIEQLLYAVGNIPRPEVVRPDIDLYHLYKHDQKQFAILQEVLQIAHNVPDGGDGPVDFTPFLVESERRFGAVGAKMALQFVERLDIYLHANPWSKVRRKAWKDVADLKGLFESASLTTQYGAFIDQRYIDYLGTNFERLDEIHWRKFEGLTAEFFMREGWRVEIGPGGNDDGVDVRVWRGDDAPTAPPAILVQCKRQKEKIEKVIVKALWADVVAEKAESGLIVTTSTLAPGAVKVCAAREYPVRQADRLVLRKWIDTMRTPGTGAFLSE